ncbi:MAG: hypothetical protein WB992_15585, partial [Bryobacteraceae bacterium]
MISELVMRAGNFDFRHVTGDAVGGTGGRSLTVAARYDLIQRWRTGCGTGGRSLTVAARYDLIQRWRTGCGTGGR